MKVKKAKTLYRDQYGNTFMAATVKDLREQIGGAVSKMYVDDKDGKSWHVGYVVGQHWCTAYVPLRRAA